ncbi:HTH-type transcriptional regulator GltC [Pseudooceanicola algae]|uniref:HTH-type transcriptional regulator GltC n=2 Tax=Pseudooceanicola algae TaxID=1537215 RepID=A0A418SHP1_9RHOB|nr:HTH-type transcriptional regulator GltC [Pseudooceanicola algae]
MPPSPTPDPTRKPGQRISLRQIECFRAVVQLGNFSRAADRLGASQTGVSHMIRDLETTLNARLFDRTTRRVDLTEAGRLFAENALPGLDGIDRAVERIRDLGALRLGQVRIAAPPLIAATVLPELLRRLRARHPELKLRVEDSGTDQIIASLRDGRCDLGVGSFDDGIDGVDQQTVLRDRLMVFAPADHPLRQRQDVPWTALRDEPIVALTRESNIRLLTAVGFESAGLPLRPDFEVHQIFTALSLVESGAGLAILPTYAFAALRTRQIIARPLSGPDITREMRIVTPRDRVPSAATNRVRDMLRRVLRDMVPEVS